MLLGILNILGLLVVAYQDFKERAVLVLLFPLLLVLMGYILYIRVGLEEFLYYSIVNMLLTSAIVFVLWGFSVYVRKQPFLNHAIGSGDLWFFAVFAVGFPTASFITLFACSLLFALMLSLFLKIDKQNIPLAGLMSIFISAVLLLNMVNLFPNPYLL